MNYFIKKMKEYRNKIRPLLPYLIITVYVGVGLFVVYELWTVNLAETPIGYGGDTFLSLVAQKNLIESSKVYESSRLGAPFGYELYDFSSGDLITRVLRKIWSIVTNNFILGVNLNYLAGFFVVAWTSLYVLKKVKISDNIAVSMATLFVFLPFHYLRGINHIAYSFYFVIPIIVLYLLRFMEKEEYKFEKKYYVIVWVLMMFCVGLSVIYYAFFSCFFMCVAILYNILNRNNVKNTLKCGISIIIITLGAICANIPSYLYWGKFGSNDEAVVRYGKEIPTFALRIAQLILPVTEHRISWLSALKSEYNKVITVTENDFVTLGLFFTIGFVILLLSFFGLEKLKDNKTWKKLAVLTVCALLYASVGGMIEVQAIFFVLIRCGNRISIFIAFFSCVALGIIIQKLVLKYKADKHYFLVSTCMLLIVIIGIYDQTPSNIPPNYDDINRSLDEAREFVEHIEKEDPQAMILQLPNVVYPEQGTVNKMRDYSHFVGFLFSDDLKWSYGAMKGRKGSFLLDNLTKASTKEMIDMAAQTGFEGIYIDRYGYETKDVDRLEKEIFQVINEKPITSSGKRYVYYSLRGYIERNNISYNEDAIKKNLVSITNCENIYPQEGDENIYWNWSKNKSKITITNKNDSDMFISFSCRFKYNGTGKLYISGDGFEDSITIENNEKEYSKVISIKPGENVLEFRTDKHNFLDDANDRYICFQIINTSIDIVKENSVIIEYLDGIYREVEENGNACRWAETKGVMSIFNASNSVRYVDIRTNINLDNDVFDSLDISGDIINEKVRIDNGVLVFLKKLMLQPGHNYIEYECKYDESIYKGEQIKFDNYYIKMP